MVYLNYDAYNDANKGLTICFIFAIVITNVILIIWKFQKGGVFHIPRNLIITSLAIGDVFLALFALVVQARMIFQTNEYEPECSTSKAVVSYRNFLIHFVYGLGLIILTFEFLQRHRYKQPTGNSASNIVKSFAYSACPWILGLIIILPLTMAGAYVKLPYISSDCSFLVTVPRFQAMYAVSVILPAVLAVLVCFAAVVVKLPQTNYSSSTSAVAYGPAQDVIRSQNTNAGYATGSPGYPGSHAVAAPYYPIQGQQLYPVIGQPSVSQASLSSANYKPDPKLGGQVFSTPSAQYPVQQYPVQQYSPQQYPLPQFPAQQNTTQSNVIFTAPTNVVYQQNTTAPTNPDKEKKALLVVAIIYFLCVVPFAAHAMYYRTHSYTINYDQYLITDTILFWLSIARSVITPTIFIVVN